MFPGSHNAADSERAWLHAGNFPWEFAVSLWEASVCGRLVAKSDRTERLPFLSCHQGHSNNSEFLSDSSISTKLSKLKLSKFLQPEIKIKCGHELSQKWDSSCPNSESCMPPACAYPLCSPEFMHSAQPAAPPFPSSLNMGMGPAKPDHFARQVER